MPNLKLVLSFFVGLILMGIPNVSNSRTVMMGVMNKKCPPNYVLVPPDPDYSSQTKYFCVAKYEMKKITFGAADYPISQPQGYPWTNLHRADAIAACQRLDSYTGLNYSRKNGLNSRFSIISNDQWQIVARNIARNVVNWSQSTPDSNARLNTGLVYVSSGGGPHSPQEITNENDPCTNTNSANCSGSWADAKRTHQLTNNETIWDFSGNAWEWVDTTPSDISTITSSAFDPVRPSSKFLSSDDTLSPSVDYRNHPLVGPTSNIIESRCDSNGYKNSSPFCGFGKIVNFDISMVYPALVRGGGTDLTGPRIDYGVFSAMTKDKNWTSAHKGFRCVYEIEN